MDVPAEKSFVKTVKEGLKETFFPDDPLRQFKGESAGRRLLLGLSYFFPILEWARQYTLDYFRADIIAGITIASLAIPQGISYAKLANLPAVTGLCTSNYIFINTCIYLHFLHRSIYVV